MSLIKNSFFKQVSLATIKKTAKRNTPNKKLEFWEAEIEFTHTKSDFTFKVTEPEKNSVTRKIIKEEKINNFETRLETDIIFEKPIFFNKNKNVKRFWTKAEADFYILFNLIQIYKPLKNYIDENNISQKFDSLLEQHPELFIKELSSGKNWLTN